MKTINFNSPLAKEMEHFVKLKQSSGSDYYSQARLLFKFDLYLLKIKFKDKRLTKTIFQNYFGKLSHLCRRGFLNHYGVIRQFSAWLNLQVSDSFVLEKRRTVGQSESRPAYILNPDEINAILRNTENYTKRGEIIPGLYQTMYSLLYTTGIRIGELFALNLADYVKTERLIHIRKGKFRKERYLVLSQSMSKRLDKYLKLYAAILPYKESAPLFVNMANKRLTYNNAYLAHVKVLKMAGIYKDKNTGPRLHDFRHTFAVHRLLQWYKTEDDINVKLPFLSTYMGHVNMTSTQIYLNVANELLKSGSERFYKFYLKYIQ